MLAVVSGGVKVSIVAFQAEDPGSIPRRRKLFDRYVICRIPVLLCINDDGLSFGMVLRCIYLHLSAKLRFLYVTFKHMMKVYGRLFESQEDYC